MLPRRISVALFGACSICFLLTSQIRAGEVVGEVHSALVELHAWLGEGPNGLRWREYLNSAELETQLARGEDADVLEVGAVLDRYDSGADGLDRARFARVREALRQWRDRLQLPEPAQLSPIALAQKEHFREIEPGSLDAARQQLCRATAALDAYLATGAANGVAWKKYLLWDKLEGQIGQDATLNIRDLAAVYQRLTANYPGLELPVFSNVTDALRTYVDAAVADSLADPGRIYGLQLDSLSGSLVRYAAGPNEADHWNIGQRLGWLEGMQQTPELIHATRHHFSRPNLWVLASERLIAAGIARPIKESTPFQDTILGTSVSGVGHTTGQVTCRLIPNRNKAVIETMFTAHSVASTVGYNGPAIIYSDGATDFVARKRTLIDENGFHTEPAVSDATTNSNVNAIATTKRCFVLDRLIKRIAWKKAGEKKGLANRIASERAEVRVNREFDAQVAEMLQKPNKSLAEKVRQPLTRRRALAEDVRFSTSATHLYLQALQAGRFQLGAPTAPPESTEDPDLGVRIHESFINNLIASLFGGETLTDERVDDIAVQLTGKPVEKSEEDDDGPWSITFAKNKPVTVLFDSDTIGVTIRGQKYTSGDREFQAMNVSAKYRIKKAPQGLKLTRMGDVEIIPPNFQPGRDQLSPGQLALHTILEKKFSKIFVEERVGDGLELSGAWKSAGKLRAVEALSQKGWLKLGWRMTSADKVAQKPVDARTE